MTLGTLQRDFSYIDDIVSGLSLALDRPATANPEWSSDDPDAASISAPYRVFNIGCGSPVNLLDYIHAIELATVK